MEVCNSLQSHANATFTFLSFASYLTPYYSNFWGAACTVLIGTVRTLELMIRITAGICLQTQQGEGGSTVAEGFEKSSLLAVD